LESSAYYVGDNIFRSNNRSTPEFVLGNTGITAGTGTSSVTGFTWLTVSTAVNEVQTIGPITGTATGGTFNVAWGGNDVDIAYDADAATVETALESVFGAGNVSCTGTQLPNGTISVELIGIHAGTNVAEMVTDTTNLQGTGPFTAPVATTQEGGLQLSIDGGTAVAIPIGDKTNVALTNPDGQVLYVNAAGVVNAGVELVEVAGTHDIFDTLITIRDVLKNIKGHTDTQARQLLTNSFDSLEELINLFAQTQSSVGSRINFLGTLEDNLTNMKYNTQDETTRMQEADIAQLAIDLSRREVLYQMSLSVTAKLMSMSLLDFL
jgi:flagellin-like hook-associated protein FlgL